MARGSDPQFQDIVIAETSYSWFSLAQQSAGSQYLLNLLNYEGESDDQTVSLTAAKFGKIVEYLFSLSDERKENQPLSELDSTLLKALASIGGCPYGKQGGINSYYPSLPAQYHLSTSGGGDDNIEAGEELLHHAMKNCVESFIDNHRSAYYKTICLVPFHEEIQEGAHQVILVKNIIGTNIGFDDRLIFDVNAGVYYLPILAASKQQTLNEFYRHFLPSRAVADIRSFINRALLEPGSKAFMQIQDTYGEILHDCDDPWETDTKNETVQISEIAVVRILQHIKN